MSACARKDCVHNGVVTIPVGHGRTAAWVRLCEPHFETWLAEIKTRSRYPCGIADCQDLEHVDGLCERHWVTLRGADPAGTPAASSTLKRFAVRHRRATIVADAPGLDDPGHASKQARTLDELARSVGRLVRSVVPEVLADVHEAATLLQGAATRARTLGAVVARGTKAPLSVVGPGPVQAVRVVEQKRTPAPARPKKTKPASSGMPQPGLFDTLFNRIGAGGRST